MKLLERETAGLDTCPPVQQGVEGAGAFFCHACLVDHDLVSPDLRYCQQCYDFLLKEAEHLSGNSRPGWIPKAGKVSPMQGHPHTIKSIVTGDKNSMDLISLPDASRPVGKRRGPKGKSLPREVILQWAGEGMGSRSISSRLRNELGINVCYKTVARALSGERQ